jgi:hypothetical protein
LGVLEFLRTTPAQAIIWGAVLLILVVAGVYAVQCFRNWGTETRPSASEMLTDFRDLHEDGSISATEFQRIRSVLGGQLDAASDNADVTG